MSTAYRRIDLLPTDAQPSIRAEFKQMITARVAAYRKRGDPAQSERELKTVDAAQDRIWKLAVAAVAGSPRELGVLVLRRSTR